MPTAQPSHGLGLDTSHAHEILSIGQAGRQLCQLRVELGLKISVHCINNRNHKKPKERGDIGS